MDQTDRRPQRKGNVRSPTLSGRGLKRVPGVRDRQVCDRDPSYEEVTDWSEMAEKRRQALQRPERSHAPDSVSGGINSRLTDTTRTFTAASRLFLSETLRFINFYPKSRSFIFRSSSIFYQTHSSHAFLPPTLPKPLVRAKDDSRNTEPLINSATYQRRWPQSSPPASFAVAPSLGSQVLLLTTAQGSSF